MSRFRTQYQSTNPFLAQSDVYRYGFQGQEEDGEVWDGLIWYRFRVENTRLGRFFSIDPLHSKYPSNSGYAFSQNMVIHMIELEGLEVK